MTVGGLSRWATRARAARRGIAGIVGLCLLTAGCGNDTGDDEGELSLEAPAGSTTADTALPSCEDVEHAVVFSVFGAATEGDGNEAATWVADPAAEPVARSGAADLVRAYQDLGYDILYVTTLSSGTQIGERPLVDAITVWLGVNDFPLGEDTRVWAWDGEGDASVALIEELARLNTAGAELGAGYASDPDLVFPLISGGISRDRMFTLEAAASEETSTSLPEDFGEHLPAVQALDPVCE